MADCRTYLEYGPRFQSVFNLCMNPNPEACWHGYGGVRGVGLKPLLKRLSLTIKFTGKRLCKERHVRKRPIYRIPASTRQPWQCAGASNLSCMIVWKLLVEGVFLLLTSSRLIKKSVGYRALQNRHSEPCISSFASCLATQAKTSGL